MILGGQRSKGKGPEDREQRAMNKEDNDDLHNRNKLREKGATIRATIESN